MGRVLAIDYGRKRCGVAVTDVLKIAANGLPAIRTCDLLEWLALYMESEQVERIIIGHPRTLAGNDSESMRYIRPFIAALKKRFPEVPVEMFDERFTSSIAHREMLAGGFKKSDRERKGFADEMAATIILTDWLNSLSFK